MSHYTRNVQLVNRALQGNILDSCFYVSHKSYKEVLGYFDVLIKNEHNCFNCYHDARNFGHFTSSRAFESSSFLLFLHWFIVQWYHHSSMTNIIANQIL
jgi:hypothetical protein